MTNQPQVSIVVPVYNEKARIANLLTLNKFLRSLDINYELLVIDDGSTDGTDKQLDKLCKKIKIKNLKYSPNQGKGYALKKGMEIANGKWCGFMDVDLSTSLSDLPKFLTLVKTHAVVVGSRRLANSQVESRQPFFRESLGRAFTATTKLVLDLPYSDFTCGCKFFSKKAKDLIFSKLTISRWGFDAEIFYLAKKNNLTITEIPVVWRNDLRTKVKLGADSFRSLTDLALIRWNDFKGVY